MFPPGCMLPRWAPLGFDLLPKVDDSLSVPPRHFFLLPDCQPKRSYLVSMYQSSAFPLITLWRHKLREQSLPLWSSQMSEGDRLQGEDHPDCRASSLQAPWQHWECISPGRLHGSRTPTYLGALSLTVGEAQTFRMCKVMLGWCESN